MSGVMYNFSRSGYSASITNSNINADVRFMQSGLMCEYIIYENGIMKVYMSRELVDDELSILTDIIDNGPQVEDGVVVVSGTSNDVDSDNINNTPLESVYSVMFTSVNTSDNARWMARDSSFSIVSDEVPYLVPWDSRLVGYSFMNGSNNRDADIKIYTSPFDEIDNNNNKELKYEISLVDCRYSISNAVSDDIFFKAGDKLAVLLEPKNGSKLKNTVFTIFLRVNNSNPVKRSKDSNDEDF